MLRSIILIILVLHSCLAAQSHVPEWARHAVWYQIFPERFRNGDPRNDPTAGDITGAWPHKRVQGWAISSWTGDWYARAPWELESGLPFYQTVQLRRYGGDLQGVLEKLDYLRDLGINAIYFNPLFESPSLHKYDATFYHHIDNNFGPDPEGDRRMWATEDPSEPGTWKWSSADSLFLRVVSECHRRGIRVIIDGVFNHVGMTFWAFQDARTKGVSSPFGEWFTIRKFDDPSTSADEFDYVGWAGVAELPELREDAQGLIAPIRDHIHAVVRRWMDPNGDGDPSDGIDGWRLDVAEKVDLTFWRDFRTWVRTINPEAYLVGEVFWEDWPNDRMFNCAPWLQGDVFDAVMNYRWAREAVNYFTGRTTKISGSEFVQRLKALLQEYPADANTVLLNLYDSHDTERLASRVVNPDLPYDKRVSLSDNPSYEIRKPTEPEWQVVKLMVLFQMTYIGAPSIYAGGESGMWGGDDPDCRKPTLWADLQFNNERSHPLGVQRPDDVNAVRPDLLEFHSIAVRYRQEHPALRVGTLQYVTVDDRRDVLAFLRETRGDLVLVVLNNADADQEVSIELPASFGGKRWAPGIGAVRYQFTGDGLRATLPGKSGITLHVQEE